MGGSMLSESGLPTRCSTSSPRAHLPKVQAHLGYACCMKPLTMGPEEHHAVKNGRLSVPFAVLRTALRGLDSPIGGGWVAEMGARVAGCAHPREKSAPGFEV
jgi:hypothetical protein